MESVHSPSSESSDDGDVSSVSRKRPASPETSSGGTSTTTPTTTTARGRPRKRKQAPCAYNRVPVPKDELFLDWDRLVAARYGKDPLNRYLSVMEVDALVGWATHQDRPFHHQHSAAAKRNDQQQAENTEKNTTTTVNSNQNDWNPLYGLPNVPPRPSVIKFMIQNPATEFAKQQQEETQHRLFQRFHHSAAVAIGMLAEDTVTASLMPLAMQHVQRCRRMEAALPDDEHDDDEIEKKKRAMSEKSDDVMMADEALNQENNAEEEEERTTDDADQADEKARAVQQAREEVFQEWTLPPEEAICNLLSTTTTSTEPSVENLFARACPPTKSAVSGAPGTSLLNMPAAGSRETSAFEAWCQSQNLDPIFVQTNYVDVFRAFVPASAATQPPTSTYASALNEDRTTAHSNRAMI